LMPCLSRNAERVFRDSSSVSNAVSQLAVPLTRITVFGVSVISSPKGSAVRTGAGSPDGGVGVAEAAGVGEEAGAGVVAAAGGVTVGLADGFGTGAGEAAGAGAAGADGVGDCASTVARFNEIAATGTNATMARRKGRGQLIRYSP
jgi:hypothetical protein